MTEIRVRFPPSPTGYLHIGGARTALCNWLFARKHGGKLVLRIEDTDKERSTEESVQAIVDGMKWMGLDWDEGPTIQSEYAQEHRATAETLIELGSAYRCYCTKEELAEKRAAAQAAKATFQGYDGSCRQLTVEERASKEAAGLDSVVRFRVPDGESGGFDDIVFGRVEPKDPADFVIVRSNGEPLYVLSNVVDDHRDRISHVIRGQDHLMNTPKQVLIYKALGWDVPRFAHLVIILDPKKAKISKRNHGEVVAVDFYKAAGFIPWAFCNFSLLMGWSTGDDREIYLSREELIAAFSLDGLGRKNAVFNYRKGDPKFITDPKALHINAEHLRALSVRDLAPMVEAELQRAGIWEPAWADGGEERAWFLGTTELIRSRFHLLSEFGTAGRAYFSDDFAIEPKVLAKNLQREPALQRYLPLLADRLGALERFDLESTETTVRGLSEELGVKAGLLINASRAALTGVAKGPGIFDIFCAIGQKRSCERLRRAATLVVQ